MDPTTPNAPTAGDSALSAQERYRMHDAFLATAMKWHQRGNTTWYLEPEYVNVMFDAVFTAALLAARREVEAAAKRAKYAEATLDNIRFTTSIEGARQLADNYFAGRAALAATQEEK